MVILFSSDQNFYCFRFYLKKVKNKSITANVWRDLVSQAARNKRNFVT